MIYKQHMEKTVCEGSTALPVTPEDQHFNLDVGLLLGISTDAKKKSTRPLSYV